MDKKSFYQILFYYEVLLNVLLWIVYDPLRDLMGVPLLVAAVLFLLIGVPAVLYLIFFIGMQWDRKIRC